MGKDNIFSRARNKNKQYLPSELHNINISIYPLRFLVGEQKTGKSKNGEDMTISGGPVHCGRRG